MNGMPTTLPGAIHWLSSLVIIALVSVSLYFIRDMHTDFKNVQVKVQQHEVQLGIINQRITDINHNQTNQP